MLSSKTIWPEKLVFVLKLPRVYRFVQIMVTGVGLGHNEEMKFYIFYLMIYVETLQKYSFLKPFVQKSSDLCGGILR